MKNAEATNTTETAAVAEQGAQVAPEKASSKKGASQKKGAPKANKAAKKAAKQAKAAPKKQAKAKAPARRPPKSKEAKVPREFSKKNDHPGPHAPRQGRDDGRDRQGHRLAEPQRPGLHQRNLTKKMGLTVESTKNEAGERTYRVAK